MLGQLRRNIDRYLTGRSSLQNLERWLLSHLQQILDSGDAKATQIANQLDADLVELGEGLIDQTILRQQLQSYLREGETVRESFPKAKAAATFHGTTAVDTLTIPVAPSQPAFALAG